MDCDNQNRSVDQSIVLNSSNDKKISDTERRAALRAAFLALENILPNRLFWLGHAIADLSKIDSRGSGGAPKRYKRCSKVDALIELNQIKERVERGEPFGEQLDAMSETSRFALWDSGAGGLFAINSPAEASRFIPAIELACKRIENKKGRPPQLSGRPPDMRANAVAVLTAHFYTLLTGQKPSRMTNSILDRNLKQGENRYSVERAGQFVALIQRVFTALDLELNAEHYARQVIVKKRKNSLKK